ncbi:MAG: hypothetical protein QM679_13115 [Patulibacter sp.]
MYAPLQKYAGKARAFIAFAGAAIVAARQCATASRGDRVGRAGQDVLVYWAAPPWTNLITVPGLLPELGSGAQPKYIGITNDFGRRCQAERAVKALVQATGATLTLPPLSRVNARRVEEALIAHFGLSRGGGGQLLNRRHEISPGRVEYCSELRIGQEILRRGGYDAYATVPSALFIGNRECFKTGAWD